MVPVDKITIIEKSISDSSLASTPLATTTPNPVDCLSCTSQKPLWVRIRTRTQFFLSEFLGTFIFLLVSFGVTAQVALGEGRNGDWTTLCLGWGVGIALGALTAAPSGSHLNPAVTLSMCIFRKHPWRNFPLYTLAQTLGAFFAAGLVYANYHTAIHLAPKSMNTAGIFATYPASFMTTSTAFLDEFIGSAILMFSIFTLTSHTHGVATKIVPLGLALVFIGISAGFGWETGFAINPARDFGPRVMTWALGYGSEVWTARGYYFWVPIVAPFLGSAFGGLVFDLLLGDGEDTPVNKPYMGFRQVIGRAKRAGEQMV